MVRLAQESRGFEAVEFGGDLVLVVAAAKHYADFGRQAPQFIAFELGTMFAPFGKIYDLATYEGLLGIKECLGAKHSSLSRQLEWERLALRDRIRPDFKVFTGNDLAIDMVMYGSDYPHNIGDMVGCLARVNALPDKQAAAVRGQNAQRIFKL